MLPHRIGNKRLKPGLLLIAALAAFPALRLEASPGNRSWVGFYAGRAFGSGYEFAWHSRSSYSDRYAPGWHAGGTYRYEFTPVFSLQGDFNLQNLTHSWTFHPWGEAPTSGRSHGFLGSLNLAGILHLRGTGRTSLFLVGGGGIVNGHAQTINGTRFTLQGGAGVRVFLKSRTRAALHLAGIYHRLLDPGPNGNEKAAYLRLQFGYEAGI